MKMKVWKYNICDGDKGIIFAETEEEAEALYKQGYDYLICDEDYNEVECYIDYICDVPDKSRIVCMGN